MTEDEHRFAAAPHAVALSVTSELVVLLILIVTLALSNWLMGG